VTPISWTVTGRSHFSRIFFSGFAGFTETLCLYNYNNYGKNIKYYNKEYIRHQKTLLIWIGLLVGIWCSTPLSKNFSYIVAVSFITGGNQSTRRKQPTCHKTLTNLIT
jgi:hypothetical protein